MLFSTLFSWAKPMFQFKSYFFEEYLMNLKCFGQNIVIGSERKCLFANNLIYPGNICQLLIFVLSPSIIFFLLLPPIEKETKTTTYPSMLQLQKKIVPLRKISKRSAIVQRNRHISFAFVILSNTHTTQQEIRMCQFQFFQSNIVYQLNSNKLFDLFT